MIGLCLTACLLGLTARAGATDPTIPPLPKAVSSFGAAVADGSIYVYGGHSGKTHTYSTETTVGTFYRFKLEGGTKWEELPGGPQMQGLALVAHNGTIIRIGGMQPRNKPGDPADNVSLASAARFNPKVNKWEDLPELPAPRSSHDAVVVGNTLVVAGGWQMNGAGQTPDWCDTLVLLDLAKPGAKWESVPQPFQGRALTMAEHDGKVYVIAGLTPDGGTSHDVHIFNLATRKWTTAPKIPGERMNGFSPAAVVLDGHLYVSPADGIVYRLSGDKWEPTVKLQTPRFVHRLVPIGGGKALALGGASRAGNVAECEVVTPTKGH
jgi:N-acetylneuraminic acid mutarotase